MGNHIPTVEDFMTWLKSCSDIDTETVLREASPSYKEWRRLYPRGCNEDNLPQMDMLAMSLYAYANNRT